MTQHILFNLASRSRPQRLYQTIEEIQRLCNAINYTILVKIDIDDRCDYSRLLDYGVEVRIGRSKNKVDAINRNIPPDGWNILVNVSDDIRFTMQGFDDIIRQHCGEDDFVLFPEPFADGQNKSLKNDRIAVMSVMGRVYYSRTNYVYNPCYTSLWCDNEATKVAEILGRLKVVEQSIFYHEHPAAGYGIRDEQYRHTESFYWPDEKIYQQRKKINFGL
jgi:hypothetical protein